MQRIAQGANPFFGSRRRNLRHDRFHGVFQQDSGGGAGAGISDNFSPRRVEGARMDAGDLQGRGVYQSAVHVGAGQEQGPGTRDPIDPASVGKFTAPRSLIPLPEDPG